MSGETLSTGASTSGDSGAVIIGKVPRLPRCTGGAVAITVGSGFDGRGGDLSMTAGATSDTTGGDMTITTAWARARAAVSCSCSLASAEAVVDHGAVRLSSGVAGAGD